MSVQAQVRRLAAREVLPSLGARRVLAVIVFAAATALGAYVSVPLPGTAVPVTLQTLFVILSGLLLGPWLGAASQATYIAAGLLGAPIFAGGPGIVALVGPTGGYLLAFPVGAWVAGRLAGPPRPGALPLLRVGVAAALGSAVILLSGAARLSLLVGGPGRAVLLGLVPFLVGDGLKLCLALLASGRLRSRTLGLL